MGQHALPATSSAARGGHTPISPGAGAAAMLARMIALTTETALLPFSPAFVPPRHCRRRHAELPSHYATRPDKSVRRLLSSIGRR